MASVPLGRHWAVRAVEIKAKQAKERLDEWESAFQKKMGKGSRAEKRAKREMAIAEKRRDRLWRFILKLEKQRERMTRSLIRIRRDSLAKVVDAARLAATMNGMCDDTRKKIAAIC